MLLMMKQELIKAILTLKTYCSNQNSECIGCEIKGTCDKYIYPLGDKECVPPRSWKIED